ncbi:MAG: neutral zinc metallopeptidase, partial [Planctomycetales bacterium]|nr:neutral zinc metallopeptidase [Planctomycetales bacterium]
MRWQGGKQSENLEDRRRIGPVGGIVAGGGAMLVIALILLCMGADPRQVAQLLQNAPVQQQGGVPQGDAGVQETPEEIRSREFAATILEFTEEVWGDQFQQAG